MTLHALVDSAYQPEPFVTEINFEQASKAFGQLYGAAERGVTRDLFGAYARLLLACGRTMHHGDPRLMWSGRPLIPFTAVRPQGHRLLMLTEIIGPIQRYPQYPVHWYLADSTMRGWAFAEAELLTKCAVVAREDAKKYAEDGEDTDADHCLRCAEISDQEAATYRLMSTGEGWRA